MKITLITIDIIPILLGARWCIGDRTLKDIGAVFIRVKEEVIGTRQRREGRPGEIPDCPPRAALSSLQQNLPLPCRRNTATRTRSSLISLHDSIAQLSNPETVEDSELRSHIRYDKRGELSCIIPALIERIGGRGTTG